MRTPFMTAFAILAAGDRDDAAESVRRLWTPMLRADTGAFWEEFPHAEASPFEMYGREFGKSLCHAWSAGPAMLLPRLVAGVRSLAPGWSRFEVKPSLGRLDWIETRVPTPRGEIVVRATRAEVEVEVPPGTTLVRPGQETAGPATLRWPSDHGSDL